MEIGHVTTTVRRKFSRACGAEMLIYVPVSTTCCLALPLPSLVAGLYQGPFRKPLDGQSAQRELYLTPPPSWRTPFTAYSCHGGVCALQLYCTHENGWSARDVVIIRGSEDLARKNGAGT